MGSLLRTRLTNGAVRLKRSNVLLLDNPTDTLDPVGTCRVESALNSYQGALVVNHDERFLR